jgi:hypothetical protein
LADSTHPRRHRSPLRRAALAAASALLIALAGHIPGARADGDPASDVLASDVAFVPADGGVSAAQQAQLAGVLAAARKQGYPIRVALIATPADLGSITELWRMPHSYADFLGQELSLIYHGTLLVVMPNGLGVYDVGATGAAATPPLSPGLARLAPGRSLAPAAVSAVTQLAAAAGHPLRYSTAGLAPSASGSTLGSVDAGSWLALAVGAALVAAAWTASLRARPLARLRRAR